MKAVRMTKYGPPEVLRIEEVEKPVPHGHQVLIKVHAASINAGDYRIMRARPFILRLMIGGLLRPKEPRVGSDVAGTVEAVGEEVTFFRPGDEVFGCAKGAFGQYVLAREDYVTVKPAGISFEQAAAVPVAALTALQGFRHAGGVRLGQQVLGQGASGGVDTFAVQLAKYAGAEVTAVCSPRNLEMVRSIGADNVFDYTKEDFTRSRAGYDVIFAINGYHSIFAYKRALTPRGVYVCAGGKLAQMFEAILLGSLLSGKNGKRLSSMGIAKVNQADLVTLAELLASGHLTPVLDRSYPLSNIVDAMHYVEDKHAQGKVVIQVNGER
jgi:NADPH:quinone reductase-like Zn-dependent oxidoreductase